jgi:hypothetical protein
MAFADIVVEVLPIGVASVAAVAFGPFRRPGITELADEQFDGGVNELARIGFADIR